VLLMRLYTRGGDKGMTSVIGGRVSKDDLRVEAYGTVDEANAFVGQAIASLDAKLHRDIIDELIEIQHELFDCGADLAIYKGEKLYKVTAAMVDRLEQAIDRLTAEAPELRRFVLPGGSERSALLHVCRTVTRRAERRVVSLANQEEINTEVRRYLNRLSDYFFAAARAVNARDGIADVEYKRGRDVF
jgi:cob(I)alamin adenosyltransferase